MNYEKTSIEDLLKLLKTNVVKFEYKKKDGTSRIAIGTLNPDYININKHIGEDTKKKERKKPENTVSYFDIERGSFRSFIKDKFVGVLNIE